MPAPSPIDSALQAAIDDVYRLALRVLWHPRDAELATETILVEASGRLAPCPLQHAPRTQILRIAAQCLLGAAKSPMERQGWNFAALAEDLRRGSDEDDLAPADWDAGRLSEEVEIGCAQSMLLCLDRLHRLGFVLAYAFGLDDACAAEILELDADAVRELVREARQQLDGFLLAHCGVIDPTRPCRCERRLVRFLHSGRVDPERLLFVSTPRRNDGVRRLPLASEPAHLFREQLLPHAPARLLAKVWRLARREPLQRLE